MMLTLRFLRLPLFLLLALVAAAPMASAEVTRVDVTSRQAVSSSGYEQIVAVVHFAVDPKNPHNRVIVDIDRAPVNAAGKVEFSADLHILRPLDAAKSNGVALVDVVNRGRKTIMRFSRATAAELDADSADRGACPPPPAPASPATSIDLGDGFLTDRGFTLVWVGWQFDVRRRANALGVEVPKASGVSGIVSAVFTPCDRRPNQPVTDLVGYPPVDLNGPDTVLTVRDGAFDKAEAIARDRWKLQGNTVSMEGGFEPGRTYELAYRAADPPIIGLGLAGFRDVASWLKHAPDALATTRYAYAFGSSQSGRFLRAFLYDGFNSDEHGAQVYDAVMAHIAGAGRLDINKRFGTPNALSMFTNATFPFNTISQRDPISGRTEGLLDNERARANQPKVFFTNSAVEQWGGGRAAPLITTTADGRADLPLAPNVRVYYFAGTQHSPGRFPARVVTGQQPYNPVDYWFALRALLVAMDQWVRQGTEPPPSQYPKIMDGTLVPVERVAFPAIPGVAAPKGIPAARQDGKALPFLVPQVDEEGNDKAGLRLPEIAVPVATFTGWNFRNASTGGSTMLVNLLGSAIPFAPTRAAREAAHDPRRSIEELYRSSDEYLARSRQATEALVKTRYLLSEDLPLVMKRAQDEWEWATTTVVKQ